MTDDISDEDVELVEPTNLSLTTSEPTSGASTSAGPQVNMSQSNLPSAPSSSAPHMPSGQAPGSTHDHSRVRQFFEGYDGILEVCIRSTDGKKLRNIDILKHLNNTYKSIASIFPSQDKLSVVLGNRIEANLLVRDTFFAGYATVTIPDKRTVEVCGAIRYDDLLGLADIRNLTTAGVGTFGDPGLKPCRILHVERVARLSIDSELVWTNTVKVTFEGHLLPKYLSICNLRIRTRLFFKSPMFCDKCQAHGHTIKHCRRKIKCARCN